MILNSDYDDTQYKELVLSLVRADTEQEVEQILEAFDLWEDNNENWQVIDEGHQNYSTIGNQQDSPDVALTEKIVNAIDAVMISKCWEENIDPESDQAPQTIAEAQQRFFDIHNGALSNIDISQRSDLAKDIMLVATGSKKRPSYTIIDKGEGQSPNSFEKTFLSLNRGNKNRIQFVQGKFGMGGTGVLTFGSPNHNLQLIISKRNPHLGDEEGDHRWGATIIRRRPPTDNMRSSVYTYLAPDKKIIAFDSESLPLLPGAYPDAYQKNLKYGSCIKLYEYQINRGLRSHINFDFYYRFSLLLPNIALPVGLYERREGFTGEGHHTILAGLSVRLDEDKRGNLEPSTPFTGSITIKGETIDYRIYVFHQGKRESYTKNDGVIFTLDGKLHGTLSQAFFRRQRVGMSYLDDSILVTVDCSKVSAPMREKLFMNSRDRLRDGEDKKAIENKLEDILANHQGLKDLKMKRIQEMTRKKLEDTKPLKDTLEVIISKSSLFRNLFQPKGELKNPFDLDSDRRKIEFVGNEYPTYFKLAKEFSKDEPKLYPINQKQFRIEYVTDANNDYFDRDKDPGSFSFNLGDLVRDSYTPSLYNGRATLTVDMPESVNIDDVLQFESQVTDVTKPEPFVERLYIKIGQEFYPNSTDELGEKRKRKEPDTLKLPEIIPVEKDEWSKHSFDKESALRVIRNGQEYDFYINVDNIYLLAEIKLQPDKVVLLKHRFIYGMVILGVSLLNAYQKQEKQRTASNENNNEEVSPEDRILEFTKAIAPALLPMIEELGGLEITE